MLFALSSVDYLVLGMYLLAMVAVGWYFSREQHTSKDFFLAGRSMGWFPVGLSIMATLLSALSYSGIPGAAYYAGFKFLLMPVAVWLCVPVMLMVVLPIYQGLGIYSVYEYLEMRFDAATRFVSSIVFVVWRLLWLGGVLYAPCKVLVVAAGLDVPMWLLLSILGLVSTGYTFLGGMKAVIWTDVIQALVMVAGVLLIIGGVWWSVDGGPARVWEVAQDFDRTSLAELEWSWTNRWSLWGLLPHFVFAMLSFYIADQITVQRYLTAKDLGTAKRSFVLNCLSVTFMVPALAYVGVCLLAFYQDHPQAMRPIWVANVDSENRQSITFPETRDRPRLDEKTGQPKVGLFSREQMDPTSGVPLMDWYRDDLSAETVASFVEQGRLLRPNSKEPFTSAEGLVDPETGKLSIDKLAVRRGDEIQLHVKAQDELMPRFITNQLPIGIAGLILAALFAASMSSMDSGLNSICTLLIMDFHRRLGWGRARLARRLNKPESELTEADELKLGRPLVLIIGVAATLFSLVVSQIDDIFSIMIAVVNTFGGPLMAIFLLGMFTRRTTARAAVTSLIVGTIFTLWIMLANKYSMFYFLWPFSSKLADIWTVLFSIAFTCVFGLAASFVIGRQKSNDELLGLVVGVGKLGVRETGEVDVILFDDEHKPGKRR